MTAVSREGVAAVAEEKMALLPLLCRLGFPKCQGFSEEQDGGREYMFVLKLEFEL